MSAGPDSVNVQDVSGKTADEATSILEEQGLVVDPVQEQDNNPDFERGEVTKTDPAAQSPVNAGSTVKLYVSTGNVELPDLRGKTRDDALAQLNALKLVGNTTEVESTEPEGTVVAQDRTGLLQQGTTVNLQIAKAATNPTVPNNLTGMTYDEAVQALAAVGLTSVQRQDLDSEAAKGEVLYTDPSGGSEVERDQTIIIYVSKGPQPGNGPTT